MDTKVVELGAYVKGVLDSAASRGLFTQAALQTMLKGLLRIYGRDAFELESERSQETPDFSDLQKTVAKVVEKSQEKNTKG
jgi:hypothetical protein